jgi:hypothetical protein
MDDKADAMLTCILWDANEPVNTKQAGLCPSAPCGAGGISPAPEKTIFSRNVC